MSEFLGKEYKCSDPGERELLQGEQGAGVLVSAERRLGREGSASNFDRVL